MDQKICIIGVYFGKLPNYFPLWLTSCEHNPEIDFLVFTDASIARTPKNVRIITLTLQQMKERAQGLFDFPIQLEKPYKCCDYKPLYGLIFSDYVAQYDYWGHCDFDLVFGDLQRLLVEHNLNAYDRYLPLGHLSLYRNTPEVNHRYKCDGSAYSYNQTFSTDAICVFDEMPGMTAVYLKNAFPMFTKRVFVDIATTYYRYRIGEIYTLDVKPINYNEQIFYWENGKTYRAYYDNGKLYTEEYLYIHFQKRPDFTVSFDPQKIDAFYITNTGFYPKTGAITKQIIHELNPYPGKWKELYEKTKRWIRDKSKAVERRIQRLRG